MLGQVNNRQIYMFPFFLKKDLGRCCCHDKRGPKYEDNSQKAKGSTLIQNFACRKKMFLPLSLKLTSLWEFIGTIIRIYTVVKHCNASAACQLPFSLVLIAAFCSGTWIMAFTYGNTCLYFRFKKCKG